MVEAGEYPDTGLDATIFKAQKQQQARDAKQPDDSNKDEEPFYKEGLWWEEACPSRRAKTDKTSQNSSRSLSGIFPNETTEVFADSHGALERGEEDLLLILLRTQKIAEEASWRDLTPTEKAFKRDYMRGGRLTWRKLEKKTGRDRKKGSQAFKDMVGRFLRAPNPKIEEKPVAVEIVHYKGRRNKRVFVKRELSIGSWKQTWSELASKDADKRPLPVENVILRAVPDTPMRTLLASLAAYFSQGTHQISPPPELQPGEWEHNIKWAEKRLRKLFNKSRQPSFADMVMVLSRNCIPCGYCATPILRRSRLAGKRITKRRNYCSDACKMKADRRKPYPTSS